MATKQFLHLGLKLETVCDLHISRCSVKLEAILFDGIGNGIFWYNENIQTLDIVINACTVQPVYLQKVVEYILTTNALLLF